MLRQLRWWAELLDSRFRIPGTNIRFGIDPILSLLPGLGDLTTPVFTILLLAQGVQQRVPPVVMLRMVVNALIDAALGSVPIVGDAADLFWRANKANLELLERFAQPGQQPTKRDYRIAWIIGIAFGVLVLLIIALGIAIAAAMWQWTLI